MKATLIVRGIYLSAFWKKKKKGKKKNDPPALKIQNTTIAISEYIYYKKDELLDEL